MAKTRVFELAKEVGIANKDLVKKILDMGIEVKSHMSGLDEFQVDKIKKELNVAEPTKIVEKRVTTTVIRRRVKKASEVIEEEPKEETEEEVQETKEEAPVEEEKPAKKTKRGRKAKTTEAPRLKIVKTGIEVEKEAVKAKEAKELRLAKAKEKKEKAKQETVLKGSDLVGDRKKKPKPMYQTLKVVAKKFDDETRDLKKEVDKEEKIKRLRERFKPEAGKGDVGAGKGFEKIKSRKRREVIDVKELRGPKYYKKKKPAKKGKKTEITTPKASKRIIKIEEAIQVGELAKRMSVKASELISKLLSMGTMVTITQAIDADTSAIVAAEFGFTVEKETRGTAEIFRQIQEAPSGELKRRPPVVTVMGHVDHGKTSLLDQIRKTQVTETEAGGITQRIGAYSVDVNDSKVVFVDTPGHEAFTSMRARGAKVTDIVVLVVAADDGVMPQTVEAINHAKDANVPVIVAINKIDKPGINPEKIRQGLTEYGLVPEDWGGDNIFANVSAKTGEGINELLDMLVLQADMLDLKADPEKNMKGVIVESRLDKGKGPVATLIVQEGTLKVGQSVVIGGEYGKVRAMQNEHSEPIKEAGPSMPVEIQGLSGVPEAGEVCYVLDDEKLARQISEMQQKKTKSPVVETKTKVSLEDLYAQIQQGQLKELKLIIKADTVGSAEAVKNSLTKLSNDEVVVKCIHEGVGGVTEGDIMLASASKAIIIAFGVRMETGAHTIAEREGVSVQFYNIIYEAIDDVKKAIEGLLDPKTVEKTLGRAEVKEVFLISKLGAIAGSSVLEGKINRSANARLLRDSSIVFEGKISSLKRFKDDVRDVTAGMECGIGIENFNDIKVGDVIECFETEEIKQTL